MIGRALKTKRAALWLITLILLVGQLTSCTVMRSNEMMRMIDSGQSIVIEVAKPDYDIVIKGEKQKKELGWVQLDQLKTYNLGFRQGFDNLFNIVVVTENNVHGKSGSLFVDKSGDRNGNTTLEDALRNKVFVTKYKADGFKDKLAELADEAYTDADGSLVNGITGAINAYYNLLPDNVNPNSFNPTQSLTRAEFYALVFRSENGVQPVEVSQEFVNAVGDNEFTKYAQGVEEYGFLRVGNQSLDEGAFNSNISRIEAVYMLVNKHFPEEMLKVKSNESSFRDVKNGKDLALKSGFKYKDKETKAIVGKDRWQAYTLAAMMQDNSNSVQEELYDALVVAAKLHLIEGPEARWNESISKAEAIQLIINTHIAKNELYGYVTEVEHGKMNLDKFKVETGNRFEVVGVDDEGRKYGVGWVEAHPWEIPVDPHKVLESGYTVIEVKRMINDSLDRVKEAGITMSDKEKREFAEGVAADLGTSLEELANCPDIEEEKPKKPVATEQPVPVKEPSKGNGQGTSKLLLETDKWYTKQEKEEARQRAIDAGKLESFEQRAKEWEGLPEWQKENSSSPYSKPTYIDLSNAKDTFK